MPMNEQPISQQLSVTANFSLCLLCWRMKCNPQKMSTTS
jgi:hypothetical protein